jgi:hypothetical protein
MSRLRKKADDVEDNWEVLYDEDADLDTEVNEEGPSVLDDYSGDKFKDQHGNVSPLNIVYYEKINDDIYSLPKDQIVETIVKEIEKLNQKYGHDDNYNFVTDWLDTFKQRAEKKNKFDIIQYFTNAVMDGNGQSVVSKRLIKKEK